MQAKYYKSTWLEGEKISNDGNCCWHWVHILCQVLHNILLYIISTNSYDCHFLSFLLESQRNRLKLNWSGSRNNEVCRNIIFLMSMLFKNSVIFFVWFTTLCFQNVLFSYYVIFTLSNFLILNIAHIIWYFIMIFLSFWYDTSYLTFHLCSNTAVQLCFLFEWP